MCQVTQFISIRTRGERECDDRRRFVFANDDPGIGEYVFRDGSEGDRGRIKRHFRADTLILTVDSRGACPLRF